MVPVVIPLTVTTTIVLPPAVRTLLTVADVTRNVPLAGCGELAAQAGPETRTASPAAVTPAAAAIRDLTLIRGIFMIALLLSGRRADSAAMGWGGSWVPFCSGGAVLSRGGR